jgi:NTE family protein
LGALLESQLDFGAIDRSIAAGHLRAISVTASGYTSGESLAFFQGHEALQPWRRAQRVGVRTRLKVEHLLASSAIPFVFPAVRINREYFGDGSMRQLAPISPAIHLGADRILVIAGGRRSEEARQRTDAYPRRPRWRATPCPAFSLTGWPWIWRGWSGSIPLWGCLRPSSVLPAGLL